MSNIVSSSDLQKKNKDDKKVVVSAVTPMSLFSHSKNQSENQDHHDQKSNFKGTGRTLNGKTVKQLTPTNEPLPTPSRFEQVRDPLIEEDVDNAIRQLDIPKELRTDFWSINLADRNRMGTHFCCYAFCPCCAGPCCSQSRKNDWIRLFKSITFYLILIQIIIYIACVALSKNMTWMLDPDLSVLIKFGANGYQYLIKYHFHRLLGYIFLHGSLIHILCNGLSQFFFSLNMEKSWGWWKFLLIYFATGIIGGLFSGVQKNVVSVGASCAIMGTMGALMITIIISYQKIPNVVRKTYFLYLLIIPFQFLATSFLPNVDWVGHLGGLISGVTIGAIIFHYLGATPVIQKISLIGGIVGTILSIVIPICLIYIN